MWRTSGEGNILGLEDYRCRECILLFWGLTSYGDSIFEEVAGFSPFMVSPIKTLCVSCLLWCAYVVVVLVILSVKRS